jgi:hypothetical protein
MSLLEGAEVDAGVRWGTTVRRYDTYRTHFVLDRLDDERPSVHAIGIATNHARVGMLAGNRLPPCNTVT